MPHDSFVLYHDYREIFDKLSDKESGVLIKAVFEYEETGKMPKLPELLSFVIIPIKQTLDRNRVKYERIKKERQEAGSKGGRQRVENQEAQANQANATFAKQNQANQAKPSVHVPVHVHALDNDTKIVTQESNSSHEKSHATCEKQKNDYTSEFEEFWKIYPERYGTNNKLTAFRQWKARLKEKYGPIQIIENTKVYGEYCQKEGIAGTKSVMMAATWIGRDKHFLNTKNYEEKNHVTTGRKSEAEKWDEAERSIIKRYSQGETVGGADGGDVPEF